MTNGRTGGSAVASTPPLKSDNLAVTSDAADGEKEAMMPVKAVWREESAASSRRPAAIRAVMAVVSAAEDDDDGDREEGGESSIPSKANIADMQNGLRAFSNASDVIMFPSFALARRLVV